MQYYDNVVELIGNTPLVRLRNVTEGIQATVLAKVEYLNPGGSVKDRIALRMVEDAEAAGHPQAGRHHRRADQRQHRRRAGPGGPAQGLPVRLRLPGQGQPGQAGRAAGVRRRGGGLPDRRRAGGPALLLQRLRPAGPGDPRRLEAQPVQQPGQPALALRDDRPGAVEADRGRAHPLRGGRRHRRHHLRHRPLPQGGLRGPGARSSARTRRARSTPAAPAGRTWSRASARTSGRRRTTGASPTRSSRSPTRRRSR